MKIQAVLSAVCLCGAVQMVQSDPAQAETIVVDGKVSIAPSSVPTPTRGSDMKSVERKFGTPQTRHPTVGKPPITRWDYQGFSVFFEGDKVISSVATSS